MLNDIKEGNMEIGKRMRKGDKLKRKIKLETGENFDWVYSKSLEKKMKYLHGIDLEEEVFDAFKKIEKVDTTIENL